LLPSPKNKTEGLYYYCTSNNPNKKKSKKIENVLKKICKNRKLGKKKRIRRNKKNSKMYNKKKFENVRQKK